MARIYVLEGCDGVGKTTLAEEINKHIKGTIIHAAYREDVVMWQYHTGLMQAAMIIAHQGDDVILDRWAPSELVYGTVFRNGPAYNIEKLIQEAISDEKIDFKWIYCRNENVIENHKKNMLEREELHDDMTHVVAEYDKYISKSDLPWIEYDFNKVNMEDFVKELLWPN